MKTVEDSAQNPKTFGELKAEEYAGRIRAGEDPDKIYGGLTPGISERVKQLVQENKDREDASSEVDEESSEYDDPLAFIPARYRNLPAEILESIWTPALSVDPEKNEEMRAKREAALGYLRDREHHAAAAAMRLTAKRADDSRAKEIRASLNAIDGIEAAAPEASRVLEGSIEIEREGLPLSSIELSNTEIHRFGDGVIEGVFLNDSHGQDAIAVRKDVCVICDGMTSTKRSGTVSAMLSRGLADSLESGSFDEALSVANVSRILEEARSRPEIAGQADKEGLSTVIACKIDHATRSIEWASIGDSPLIVVDRDESGAVVSFEILTEDVPVTNATYASREGLAAIQDPETHGVGLQPDGSLRLSGLKKVTRGRVEYKKGRSVVLASDFLTKMLSMSPEAYDVLADTTEKEAARPLFKALADKNDQNFSELWIDNPSTGGKTLNPPFFADKSADELMDLLTRWKAANTNGNDDATMAAIDMDKAFAEAAATA